MPVSFTSLELGMSRQFVRHMHVENNKLMMTDSFKLANDEIHFPTKFLLNFFLCKSESYMNTLTSAIITAKQTEQHKNR